MQQYELILCKVKDYKTNELFKCISNEIFSTINSIDKVVKPNWIRHSHLGREGEWDYVITQS